MERGNDASRSPLRSPSLAALGLLACALWAGPAGASAVSLELSANRDYRAWSLLGDVPLAEDETYLTLGYGGARPQADSPALHQLSVGMDHAPSLHWLVSGALVVGLPRGELLPLAPERPLLRLPGLGARTRASSLGCVLGAGYDSGGFSDVEYGLDAGLGLTGYRLVREMFSRQDGQTQRVFGRQEALWVARPSLGGRLLPGPRWELGLRASVYLYSADPQTAGQFTEEEQEAVLRRYASAVEGRLALREYLRRQLLELGAALRDANAVAGFPSAPVRFDVKPSATYRFGAGLRAQLAYTFTRYVSGQGVAHVLSTRWTARLGEPLRLWASLALQSDVPEEGAPVHSALFSLGGEYSF